MASNRPTNALKTYLAQATANRETVEFDQIIFANIPNLNDTTLANVQAVPTAAQIRHRANVQQTGYLADDEVVYSVTLGTDVGDFTFNFVGLVNSKKNLLGVAIYTGNIAKTRTKASEQGNALTRNIVLQFRNAKTLTNITMPAKSWQFDFTDRFMQIKPKTLTATSTNTADSTGHTHEIAKASTAQAGVVKLNNSLTSTATNEALTANQGKVLNDKITALSTTAKNQADSAANRAKPKNITADTVNAYDNAGHTHYINKASTAQAGVVKLNNGLVSTSTTEALTANQGKVLNDKISNAQNAINNAQNAINAMPNQIAQAKKEATTTQRTFKKGKINYKGKTFPYEGYLIKHPDGTIKQTFHVSDFRTNGIHRAFPGTDGRNDEIKDGWSLEIPLWEAMPNGILFATPLLEAQSATVAVEAGEHVMSWAKRYSTKSMVAIEGGRISGHDGNGYFMQIHVLVEGF